jgi:uncharacterized repeat protein (TIGR02543 family)
VKFKVGYDWVSIVVCISSLAFVGLVDSPAAAAALPDGQYSCATGTTSGSSPTYEIAADVLVGSSGSDCAGAVVIPSGVTRIADWAFFAATSVTSVTIPASVTSIGVAAFRDATSLTSVTLSEGVTSIGGSAFQGATALTSMTIPASVTSIGGNAFSGATSLTSISFAANSQLVSIGSFAFNNMPALTSIVIPNGVTSIGSGAFSGATSLASVTIPASVTSIGSTAFADATSLVHVYFLGNAPGTVGSDAFYNIGSSPTVHILFSATGFNIANNLWNGLTVSYRYTATFNSTGGSSVSSVNFFSSGSIAEPTAPTRVGHTFSGWSLTQGGAAVSFPYTPTSLGDVVFYAKWTAPPAVDNQAPVFNSAPAVVESQIPITKPVTQTFSSKKLLEPKSLAKQVGVKIVSTKATVALYVAVSSRKVCLVTGSRLKTLKAGKCIVTFTVQEPKTKSGKLPRALKQVKTLIIK